MTTRPNPFGAVCTAMITPFDAHGAVDVPGLQTLADYLLTHGTNAIVATGTTGESPTLSDTEKLLVLRTLKTHLGKRAPLIAGTGSNATHHTLELSRAAQEIGVDGLLVVNPYYNKPSQAGLFQHFSAVAAAVDIPVILYNHPGRTGVCLSIETICALVAAHANIVAIKDSSGDLGYLTELRAKAPDSFLIFSGDDPLTLPILSLGGDGVISVASHVAGPEIAAMMHAWQQGNIALAQRYHLELYGLSKALFCAPSPAPTKAALALNHLPAGGVRLPLTPLETAHQQQVEAALAQLAQFRSEVAA
jgi:4-hydroxy-tetrahydrodipicolinate synthase